MFAGNPDRQGEAGAPELLMNPWARSAGLHTMNTSNISGVESMRLNVAGLSRINSTEIAGSYMNYMRGSGLGMSAFGIAQKVGKSGALGISLAALDFGNIPVTTTNQPQGTGATFSPRFFHLGVGYSHMFENKISVGVLVRSVNESIENVSASTIAMDAGVQYVTGEKDNFKFGISLRNVGGRLKFEGEGLTTIQDVKIGGIDYPLAVEQRSASLELQSLLNMGLSYDFYVGNMNRITAIGNYTSNSFSQDFIGGGLEYAFNEMFMLRGAYRYEVGSTSANDADGGQYTGLAAGFTLQVPFSKKADSGKLGIDYSYRATRTYDGSHNLGIRIML